MASYDQTPGVLNLQLVRGDDFSALIDFSISMTGYTCTSSLTSLVTGSDVKALTVSTVAATAGQFNVSLSDTETSALARGTYGWKFTWTEGTATRTALNGYVEVH